MSVLIGLMLTHAFFAFVPDDLEVQEDSTQKASSSNEDSVKHGVWKRKEGNIHYREQGEGERGFLLLHGSRFHSGTWHDLGTLQAITKAGYRVVAVDLPGYGRSPESEGTRPNDLDFMIKHSGLKQVILVAPSMSGAFAFPWLLEHSKRVDGFVPVAPGGVLRFLEQLGDKKLSCKTLILWGEDDSIIPVEQADRLQARLGETEKKIFEGASHAFYLEASEEFHRTLIEWAKKIWKKKSEEPGGDKRSPGSSDHESR